SLGIAGCDPVFVVETTVLVTPAAQQDVTLPAQLVVREDHPVDRDRDPVRIAVACAPAEEIVARWDGAMDIGCVDPIPIVAWLAPLDEPGLACGPIEPENQERVPAQRDDDMPVGRGTGYQDAHCDSGPARDEVTIRIE